MIPKFEHRTKFQESQEPVETVIVVLQGLMSSKIELVQGCDEGV